MTRTSNAPSTLARLGERGFLNKILPTLSSLTPGRFLIPPGDDAAILSQRAVLSNDGLTEGTHFKSSWSTLLKRRFGISLGRALGWKLLGSSLSDLAAMGDTRHRWAMIYLGAPPTLPVSFLSDLNRGVREAAARFDCALAGGDTVRARELTLVSAVGGELKGRALRRSGARPGDALCIAGTVGDAAMGLDLLEGRRAPARTPRADFFVRRFFEHAPLFEAGAALSSEAGVTALMDLSDALDECVGLLASASRVGVDAEIEQIPVSRPYAELNHPNPRIIAGGEDYALLFTAKPSRLTALRKRLRFFVIGSISATKGVRWTLGSKAIRTPRTYRHFR
jgi:thiamine-monophosphate kinase